MPVKPQPGRILYLSSDPALKNRRGYLVVEPAAHNALRAIVLNDLGGEIVNIVAHGTELSVFEVPRDALSKIDAVRFAVPRGVPATSVVRVPGAVWFYTREGVTLGFLMDSNAGVYSLPADVAVESLCAGNPFVDP